MAEYNFRVQGHGPYAPSGELGAAFEREGITIREAGGRDVRLSVEAASEEEARAIVLGAFARAPESIKQHFAGLIGDPRLERDERR